MESNNKRFSLRKDWKLVNFCEFDKYATKSYCAIHDVDENLNLGDITKIDETKLEDFNMICGGSPCFVKGTKVLTTKGYKNIEDIQVGDMVLTHKNRYMSVVNIGGEQNQEIYSLRVQGFLKTECTDYHPFYCKKNKNSVPEKIRLNSIRKGYYIGSHINNQSINEFNLSNEGCWILGRYVADGHIRKDKRKGRKNSYQYQCVLSVGNDKVAKLKEIIKENHFSCYPHGASVHRVVFSSMKLVNFIIDNNFGRNADTKNIPPFIIDLPIDKLESFLDGYMSGDGCEIEGKFQATTVSKELAMSLCLAIQKVYRVGCRIYFDKRPDKYEIEGRIINQKSTYMIRFMKESQKQAWFIENDIIWYPVKEILNTGKIEDVYNIEVKEDHTYTANNMITFNCQDFSVAGKQKGSVWTCKDCGHEYNPLTVHWSHRNKCPHCSGENIEKTRSSLLVEYLRVIRANKPNFGMYENVKNIVGKQFRNTTFKLFEDELHEYGYNTYWKVLNAKDYGVPQNRERVYLIFIKKGLDNSKFVFPEGFDNGIRLKDVLEDEVDEKYYISDDKVQRFLTNLNSNNSLLYDPCQVKREGKSREYNDYCPTLTSRDYKDPRLVNENVVKQVGNISDCNGNWKNPQVGRIYDPDGCSPTLNTCGGGSHEPKIVCGIDKSVNDTKQIEYANCITTREDRGISNRKSEGTAVLETPDYSYCLDANYYKGTTIEQYVDKHRRQLVSEITTGELSDYINAIIGCLDIMNRLKNGGLEYEERYKKCREILYVLWNEIREETVQWKARGFWCVQEKEILQSGMYGEIQIDTTKSRCGLENSSQYSTKNQQENLKENKMRTLWKNWKTRCSSYKLELEGQFIDEFTNFMSQLSQQDSQTQKCMLDMWTTNERTRILQQALFKIQEIWMSFNEEERIKMSELQSNNRRSNEMCGIRIRKLTPKECFRLQGFPDSAYETASKVVSNSQLYKQSGNSIVVDVLYYILVELYKAMPYLFDDLKLSSFFSGIGAFEVALDRLYESINTGNFTKPQVE